MKTILFPLVMVLTLLIGAVWYMENTEQQESHFETYQTLQASELITKGWVPDIIPRSAYDIYEEHRVDQDRVHVRFRFLAGDTASIEKGCKKQEGNSAKIAIYQCPHGNGVVSVRLQQDGTGEMVSD
ncbi:hypothetical protein COMA1_11317 [Candidatus Nitrospira nitrosa]|uniref:YbbD head domain-containing protein n=2 Tax=Candidatus Nitrospira nitrosa TaxID=1742972 RepID=A0A0S4L7F5_9BACT|nr:hypothetical protein COMA1_11317 [Candidatus Nitrospira nitrosa]